MSENGARSYKYKKRSWNLIQPDNSLGSPLHKILIFPLRTSSVNVTKFAGNSGFVQTSSFEQCSAPSPITSLHILTFPSSTFPTPTAQLSSPSTTQSTSLYQVTFHPSTRTSSLPMPFLIVSTHRSRVWRKWVNGIIFCTKIQGIFLCSSEFMFVFFVHSWIYHLKEHHILGDLKEHHILGDYKLSSVHFRRILSETLTWVFVLMILYISTKQFFICSL